MKQPAKILIVDDEQDILLSLKFFLSQHFSHVDTLGDPTLLPEQLATQSYDILMLDMNFKKGDTSGREGLAWLKRVGKIQPGLGIIMVTAYADVKMAVEAVKLGAIDFIEKPWRNERLLTTLLSAYSLSQSKKEIKALQASEASFKHAMDQSFGEIIGQSPAMQKVFTLIKKVAATDADVLILGENGTGKELVARSIHRQSPRSDKVFISVDLGAIPSTLFESELFGHKKGAFTDARETRVGHFEAASKGTLFLDEIGNLSLPLQAKLLTALQNREIRKVGSTTSTPIDIRLICATNMPLYKMVKEKDFRQDLLYRINTVEIELPPLRDRAEDIPILAEHFKKLYARKYQKTGITFTKATLQKLRTYEWPGNIRELRHAVERALILSEGEVLKPEDFILQGQGQVVQNDQEFDSFNLEDIEKWAIRKAMTKYQGNISHAAQELGLTRAALYRRLAKHGL